MDGNFSFIPVLTRVIKSYPSHLPMSIELCLIILAMVGRQKLSRFPLSMVQSQAGFYCNFVIRTQRRNHINQR